MTMSDMPDELQRPSVLRRLKEKTGSNLTVDGMWGPKSSKALDNFMLNQSTVPAEFVDKPTGGSARTLIQKHHDPSRSALGHPGDDITHPARDPLALRVDDEVESPHADDAPLTAGTSLFTRLLPQRAEFLFDPVQANASVTTQEKVQALARVVDGPRLIRADGGRQRRVPARRHSSLHSRPSASMSACASSGPNDPET
jgi:hypothetical protein